ncbi:MAG: DUF3592 domain-containing protein [Synergistaceae bacterium]|jgi:uncharacterized membrane protein HdeD (DUF308 family)|nr:DUF3592 domain-containing protein [Synergistaceae bacterium]
MAALVTALLSLVLIGFLCVRYCRTRSLEAESNLCVWPGALSVLLVIFVFLAFFPEWEVKNANRTAAALICGLFGLLLLPAGLLPVCKSFLKRRKCTRLAPGKVVSFERWEERVFDPDSRVETLYVLHTPVVEYRVGGEIFTASTEIFGAGEHSKRVDERGKVLLDPGLTEGCWVNVFYNPDDPSEAAWETRMKGEAVMAAIGAGLIVIGLVILE